MNFKFLIFATFIVLTLAVSINHAKAEVKLHPIFTDNMVLQRDKPIVVWGTAAPGEKVRVLLANESFAVNQAHQQDAVADANGNWKVELKPHKASPATLEMVVKGYNKINLINIAIGDVYICSGQSNMEWPVNASNNASAEIAAANFPNIRLLTVPKKIAATPQKEFAAATSWQVCSPETIGEFSAVAYFFGREINQKTKIPIGLIDASWGGTVAEAWTSREALMPLDPAFRSRLETLDKLVAESQKTGAVDPMIKWWQDNDAGLQNGNNWSAPDFDNAAWPEMTVPQTWESTGIEEFKNFDGLVWFRKQIEIPADWEGKDLTLHLGAIDDNDTTFWNGVEIGNSTGWNTKRVYNVPGNLVKAGRAIIAVRVFDGAQGGGLIGGEARRIEWKDNAQNSIALDGVWKLRASTPSAKLTARPSDWQNNPNQTSVLFNGMIAPLVRFPVRGAIWYQGESNAGYPQVYRTLFPALIRDWRAQWNAKKDGEDFGFYFVQLANYMARSDQPVESGWAELRETQTDTLSTPFTGMATTIDIGEGGDIHPRNKQDVGKRLALVALAKEYRHKIEYSGPMFSKMEMIPNTNRVRISFTHAAGLTIYPPRAKEVDGEVPLSNWTYGVLKKISDSGVIEGYRTPDNFGQFPLSRKELAVTLGKILGALGNKNFENQATKNLDAQSALVGRPELHEAIMPLAHEFAPELKAMGIPVLDISLLVKGFAVRGEDGKWFWAQAHLDGETVVLWSDEVLKPVAVRYAWANNPDVNLVNGAGLPAVPFRTDAP